MSLSQDSQQQVFGANALLTTQDVMTNPNFPTEHRLFEQFKAIPNNAPASKLVRKYLEFCWSLPYYGSAFFRGQIETPARSITSYFVNR